MKTEENISLKEKTKKLLKKNKKIDLSNVPKKWQEVYKLHQSFYDEPILDKDEEENIKKGYKDGKQHYFDVKNMLNFNWNAKYYLAYSERSDGKSYSCLLLGLCYYFVFGNPIAYIRRYEDEVIGSLGQKIFLNFLKYNKNGENVVSRLSNGEYNYIKYYGRAWYLAYYDEEQDKITRKSMEPFCYSFTLNNVEKAKSGGYPKIDIIFFDEFMSRRNEMIDEWTEFSNTLSTILRKNNTDAKIFMMGNTVKLNSLYFQEMGIKRPNEIKKGDYRLYQYGESKNKEVLKVVVHRGGTDKKNRQAGLTDVYFAFDNPKMRMITEGEFEIPNYPHLTKQYRYSDKEVVYRYFINFRDFTAQCEVVKKNNVMFTFIYEKTKGKVKLKGREILFQEDYSPERNVRRCINNTYDKLGKKIYSFFVKDKVFYSNNTVGEYVKDYLNWCDTAKRQLRI